MFGESSAEVLGLLLTPFILLPRISVYNDRSRDSIEREVYSANNNRRWTGEMQPMALRALAFASSFFEKKPAPSLVIIFK